LAILSTKVNNPELISTVLDELVDKVGAYIALLHSNDQIHGDLTTSNMMLKPR
jgi:tRNA A-37 threonylcarbamoyl transferase component Bud32